eukprot:3746170-Rhodomonas_salina.3
MTQREAEASFCSPAASCTPDPDSCTPHARVSTERGMPVQTCQYRLGYANTLTSASAAASRQNWPSRTDTLTALTLLLSHAS